MKAIEFQLISEKHVQTTFVLPRGGLCADLSYRLKRQPWMDHINCFTWLLLCVHLWVKQCGIGPHRSPNPFFHSWISILFKLVIPSLLNWTIKKESKKVNTTKMAINHSCLKEKGRAAAYRLRKKKNIICTWICQKYYTYVNYLCILIINFSFWICRPPGKFSSWHTSFFMNVNLKVGLLGKQNFNFPSD